MRQKLNLDRLRDVNLDELERQIKEERRTAIRRAVGLCFHGAPLHQLTSEQTRVVAKRAEEIFAELPIADISHGEANAIFKSAKTAIKARVKERVINNLIIAVENEIKDSINEIKQEICDYMVEDFLDNHCTGLPDELRERIRLRRMLSKEGRGAASENGAD